MEWWKKQTPWNPQHAPESEGLEDEFVICFPLRCSLRGGHTTPDNAQLALPMGNYLPHQRFNPTFVASIHPVHNIVAVGPCLLCAVGVCMNTQVSWIPLISIGYCRFLAEVSMFLVTEMLRGVAATPLSWFLALSNPVQPVHKDSLCFITLPEINMAPENGWLEY